jgi:hypothetical protein
MTAVTKKIVLYRDISRHPEPLEIGSVGVLRSSFNESVPDSEILHELIQDLESWSLKTNSGHETRYEGWLGCTNGINVSTHGFWKIIRIKLKETDVFIRGRGVYAMYHATLVQVEPKA